MLHFILAFIHIIICVVLVFFILIQSNKGMGLAGAFGSAGASDSVFGSGSGGFNVLVKITIGLSLIFTVTCCTLSFIPHGSRTQSVGVVDQALQTGSVQDLVNESKAGAGAQKGQLPAGQQPIPAQQQQAAPQQQQPAPKQ